jgi:hypothetical protein
MTEPNATTRTACESLAQLGHAQPREALQGLRAHLARHAVEPLAAVRALMRGTQLLCLGEMHDFAGRFMSAELVAAAAQGGARWLFIEVYASQQTMIDRFIATGLHEQLPASAGGGSATPMRFQQPYVEMLHAARLAGMRIVAIDVEGADFDERNRAMAWHIEQCLLGDVEGAGSRGVAIVGQLHLVPRSIFGHAPSMATHLRASLGGSLVTIGRAVPDEVAQFSVWADVADVAEPCLMRVQGSPFEGLASTYCDETLRGSDFDHIFFYPAAAVRAQPVGAGARAPHDRPTVLQSHLTEAAALLALAGGSEPLAARALAWAHGAEYAGRELLAARMLGFSQRAGQGAPIGELRQLATEYAAHHTASGATTPVEARVRAGLRELLRDAGGSRADQARLMGNALRRFRELGARASGDSPSPWPLLDLERLITGLDRLVVYENDLDAVLGRARGRLKEWEACAVRGEKPLVLLDLDQTMLAMMTDDHVSVSELASMPVDEAERRAHDRALQAKTTGQYTTVRGMVELVREFERRGISYVYVSANDPSTIERKTKQLRELGAFGAHALAPRSASRTDKHDIYAQFEQGQGYVIKAVFDDTRQNLPGALGGDAADARDFELPTLSVF